MSYGTLKLEDGSIMPVYNAKVGVQPDVFFRGRDYLDEPAQRLWVNGFGLPEDVIPCVHDEIGRLAQALMDASFVSRETAVSVGAGRVQRPGLSYTSSLTDSDAAGAISAWFPGALRAVIDRLPAELQTRFTNSAEVLPAPGEEPTFHASDTIVVGSGVVSLHQLDRVSLIDPNVANLIDAAFESGVAAVIEQVLRFIGCAILQRAQLSQSSLNENVRDSFVRRGRSIESSRPGDHSPTHYSTLDADNCVEWMKGAMQGSNLIGVALGLPETSREKVFANLRNAKGATRAMEDARP